MGIFGREQKATQSSVEELREALNALTEITNLQASKIANSEERIEKIAELLTQLDGKIARVGTEVGNQIHELGNEISTVMNKVRDTELHADEAFAQLATSQQRIANEQARYEIAFRQDLATIADLARRRS